MVVVGVVVAVVVAGVGNLRAADTGGDVVGG